MTPNNFTPEPILLEDFEDRPIAELQEDYPMIFRLLRETENEVSRIPQDQLERMVFGFNHMDDIIVLETDAFELNAEDLELAEADMDPDNLDYDNDRVDLGDPCVFDLNRDGSFTLNDGYHRFVLAEELGVGELRGEVQFIDREQAPFRRLRKIADILSRRAATPTPQARLPRRARKRPLWRDNPINWSSLNWAIMALQTVLSGQAEELIEGDKFLIQNVLDQIAEEHPDEALAASSLAAQLSQRSQRIWLPRPAWGPRTFQQRMFDAEYDRLLQIEHQLLWQISTFLHRFQQQPSGFIVAANMPVAGRFEYIKQQIDLGNPLALPEYLRITGHPPDVKCPGIRYQCLTHHHYLHWTAHPKMQCPKTIWKDGYGTRGYFPSNAKCVIQMQLDPYVLSNWLNCLMDQDLQGHPRSLFAIKKKDYPDPTNSKTLLNAFYQAHNQEPAYLLFEDEIKNYFGTILRKVIPIIAELQTLDRVGRYPVQVVTWKELCALTNLRTDLIIGRPPSQHDRFSRNISFLLENFYPTSILRTPYAARTSRNGVPVNPPTYWLTSMSFRISFSEGSYPGRKTVEAEYVRG